MLFIILAFQHCLQYVKSHLKSHHVHCIAELLYLATSLLEHSPAHTIAIGAMVIVTVVDLTE